MGQKILRYAGIGPRSTPPDALKMMELVSNQMTSTNWILSSGWGAGADQAFGMGAHVELQTQWIPWANFNGADGRPPFKITSKQSSMAQLEARTLAMHCHPYWSDMRNSTRELMTRNVFILLGDGLQEPVDLVMYWQSQKDDLSLTSGTNHTRRVAEYLNIPCFNLRIEEEQDALAELILKLEAAND